MKASRWTLLLLLFAMAAPGCLWRPKPYDSDPLIRNRKAVLGESGSAPRGPIIPPEPLAPEAEFEH